jgi:hypothetical protein
MLCTTGVVQESKCGKAFSLLGRAYLSWKVAAFYGSKQFKCLLQTSASLEGCLGLVDLW